MNSVLAAVAAVSLFAGGIAVGAGLSAPRASAQEAGAFEYKAVTSTDKETRSAAALVDRVSQQEAPAGWQVVSLTPVEVKRHCEGSYPKVNGVSTGEDCAADYLWTALLRRPKP